MMEDMEAAPEGATQFDFTRQPGFMLRRLYQRTMGIYQRYSIDPTMTSVQFAVLYSISNLGPCSLATIGRHAAIDPATTRGVVERLRKRRFVSSEADAEDRRKSLVALTPAGAHLVRQMIPASRRITEVLMAPLSPPERVALTYLMTKLLGGEPDEAVAVDDV